MCRSLQRETGASAGRPLLDRRDSNRGSPNRGLHRGFVARMSDDDSEEFFEVDEVGGELGPDRDSGDDARHRDRDAASR